MGVCVATESCVNLVSVPPATATRDLIVMEGAASPATNRWSARLRGGCQRVRSSRRTCSHPRRRQPRSRRRAAGGGGGGPRGVGPCARCQHRHTIAELGRQLAGGGSGRGSVSRPDRGQRILAVWPAWHAAQAGRQAGRQQAGRVRHTAAGGGAKASTPHASASSRHAAAKLCTPISQKWRPDLATTATARPHCP